MDGARHAKRRAGALLVAIVLAAAAGSALGALDSVKGPREHPVEGQITQLQRQLFEAVLEGDSNLLSITNLITAGADPNGYDEKHMTALHLAVIKGQRLAVALLLARGGHVDVRDMAYRTPMHYCAAYGWGVEFPSVLTELYLAGANLNSGDQAQNTPLHLAAFEGHTATALQLIYYGARPDATNLWQQATPLGMAVKAGNAETATALRATESRNTVTSLPACQRAGDVCATCQTPVCYGAECLLKPCPSRCTNPEDRSNLRLGASNWGCKQNNFFIGQQNRTNPSNGDRPLSPQQRGTIQGTCVS